MIPDQLDALLDETAPPARTIDAATVHVMLAEARTAARPRRRSARGAVLGGVLAALLVGGAGVATASSDWIWIPGLESSDRSYTFTAPTWGECELRYSGLDTHNPLLQARVDRVIDDWFANTDVEAAAAPYVAEHLARIEAAQAGSDEAITDPRLPDLNAWQAHDQALSQALHDELKANGIDSGRGDLAGAEGFSQLHCEGEDWGGGE